MSITTTNYISKIKQSYPTAGVDNDSQGFRDNFKNISLALTSVNTEVEDLVLNSFKLNQTNAFDDNIIQGAAFQDCSLVVNDDTILEKTGNVDVDYRLGSYQKFRLSSGSHTFTVSNLPGANRSGSVILHITTSTTSPTTINFSANTLINLGKESYPYTLNENKPYIFELFSDGSENILFVKKLNNEEVLADDNDIDAVYVTATYLTANLSLNLNGKVLTSNANNDIVVSVGNDASELAFIPNQFTTTITGVVLDPPFSSTIANKFTITDTTGIKLGANFTFVSNTVTSVFTVTNIVANTIYTQNFESLDVPGISGSSVTFTNKMPTGATSIATLRSNAPSSINAAKGDLKGQIYANTTSLWVSFADYSPSTQNWFTIDKNVSAVTENSNKIATTEFVHDVLPYGAIIMWYGTIANIPTGWTLCDGTNGTPDLRNRFVIGANADTGSTATSNVTGTAAVIGGTKDSIVVSHSHSATTTVGDHNHGINASDGANYVGAPPLAISQGFGSTDGSIDGSTSITSSDRDLVSFSIANASLSPSTSVSSTGTSGTNANLPPFYALAYIMKTTGA